MRSDVRRWSRALSVAIRSHAQPCRGGARAQAAVQGPNGHLARGYARTHCCARPSECLPSVLRIATWLWSDVFTHDAGVLSSFANVAKSALQFSLPRFDF